VNAANINVTTFIAGLLFMTLGGLFLLDAAGIWSVHPLIVGPVVLIGLGLAMIAGSLVKRSA
jgi:hypothetical protein